MAFASYQLDLKEKFLGEDGELDFLIFFIDML